ncbi:MAG: DedA family protein [Bacteroidaceae bacterium]|nr:DedA family protein [Bacteroidaceae bacterium]
MESVAFIQWCLDNLNYWSITLLMAIESSFIPFPSEVIIPPAAYKAAVNNELNIFLVIIFATIGSDLGALVNYYLAKWLGRPIIYKFADSRLGHLCLIDKKKVIHAEKFFYRNGALSTFIGRLIPAVRQLISIPAGISRMKIGKFLFYTTLGAGFWNSVLAAIGYYLSKVPGIRSEEELLTKVSEYSHEIGYSFVAIGILIIAYFIYKGTSKKITEKT